MKPSGTPSTPITITIVYDNYVFDDRLKTAWGFAALVQTRSYNLLFDTGGDGPTLLNNMDLLGIDPGEMDAIVLSHAHGDHTGGLGALLEFGDQPMVYVPPSFPVSIKRSIEEITEVVEVTPGQMIAEEIFTTGEMGRDIAEQALVIKAENGLVIITGCAHPGIVNIVEQAKSQFDQPVDLVLGGFHLGSKSQAEIDAIVSEFQRLEVKRVAPCHCTGSQAIECFAAEYGENFLQVGAGKIIQLDAVNR